MKPCLVTCANCDRLQCNNKRLKCSRCHIAYYCNKQCQRDHWKKQHKYHCRKQQQNEKIIDIVVSEEEKEKVFEFNAILYNDGILPKNGDESDFERGKWKCHGALLNKLSQKYHDHHSLLLSGYIRMNVSKEKREQICTNWIFHKEHKYELNRSNVILSQYSEKSYNQILFDLILCFMTPPLIISGKNNKKYKTEYFQECLAIIDTVINQRKYFFNNIGYCLIHNTLRSYSLTGINYYFKDEPLLLNLLQFDLFPDTFKYNLRLFMVMLAIANTFSKMILLLSNDKIIQISSEIKNNDNKNKNYNFTVYDINNNDIDFYNNIETSTSSLTFEFDLINKQKHLLNKYYIDSQLFGEKCYVQKGKIYGINGSDILTNINKMILIHAEKMTNSLLMIQSKCTP